MGTHDDISEKVNHYLYEKGVIRRHLAKQLGIREQCLYNRVNGRTLWSLEDAFKLHEIGIIDLTEYL